jgi:hypothetical protein
MTVYYPVAGLVQDGIKLLVCQPVRPLVVHGFARVETRGRYAR